MNKTLLIQVMYILTCLLIFHGVLWGEDATVTIIGHYKEPAGLDDANLILLDGVQDGEYLEILIDGTIYDFEHMKINFFASGDDLIFTDTLIHSLGDLSNQRIIIKTYLPEGIPSEKIKWKGVDGKEYEYTFYENGMGDNNWVYNVHSTNVAIRNIDGYWAAIKENYNEEEIKEKFNLPVFSPLGWSKDGKMAYLEKYEFPRKGGTVIGFYIVDAVTDEIIYTKKYDSFKIDGNLSDVDLINYVTKTELPYIESVLNTYNIITQEDFSLLTFPVKLGELEYKMNVDTAFRASGVFPGMEVLSRLEINVIRSDGKRKTVLYESYSSRTGDELSDVIVLGIMKSPYEERMIILYTFDYYYPDWGATLYTRITGSHLTTGFK